MRKPNLLILSAGRRTRLIDYLKKETHSLGGYLVTADCSSMAPALHLGDHQILIPRLDDPDYLTAVMDICRRHEIAGILSLIDPELSVIARYRDDLAKTGAVPIVSPYETCEMCLDKYATAEFCLRNGFQPAMTFLNMMDFEHALDEGKLDFPVIIKPRLGSASLNTWKAANRSQASSLFGFAPDMIVQSCLQGPEFGVDVYVDLISRDVVSIFIKEKIAMRAGETDKARSVKCDSLFALARDVALKANLLGPIDMDFFYVNGSYHLLEINPRFGGGYPLAYECGVNFPRFILNNLQGITNQPAIGHYDENVTMLKHDTVMILPAPTTGL